MAWLYTAAGVSIVAAITWLIRRLGCSNIHPKKRWQYKFVDCWYCMDENGKSQGWLELFNSAEHQGKTGYWPATRINGNVIACPACGATGKVEADRDKDYSTPEHRF
jgi:hypothetical protein